METREAMSKQLRKSWWKKKVQFPLTNKPPSAFNNSSTPVPTPKRMHTVTNQSRFNLLQKINPIQKEKKKQLTLSSAPNNPGCGIEPVQIPPRVITTPRSYIYRILEPMRTRIRASADFNSLVNEKHDGE